MSGSNTSAASTRHWDEVNGVWVGDRAPSSGTAGGSSEDELEVMLQAGQPLYIFGYGSLIWRSGDLLSACRSYRCFCRGGEGGWKRRFAQRSMDHRGRPAFPGLVFNLVPAGPTAYPDEGQESDRGHEDSSGFIGVVYLVPAEDARRIIDELDFRERGGYERCTAEVVLMEESSQNSAGETIKTIVYIGNTDNPNFIHYGSEEGFHRKASIISAAFGPSGQNSEYLFRVVEYFRRHKLEDKYLLRLENAVRSRLGVSRGHNDYMLNYYQCSNEGASIQVLENQQDAAQPSENSDLDKNNSANVLCQVMGLGSNEWGQLIRSPSRTVASKYVDDLYFSSMPSRCAVASTAATSISPELEYRKFLGCQVLAGGSHSGLLVEGRLSLWGSNSRGQLGPMSIEIPRPCDKEAEEEGAGGIVLAAALGHEHSLVLLVDGTVVSFGDDEYGQCSGTCADIPATPTSLPFLKYITKWEEGVSTDSAFWNALMMPNYVFNPATRVVHVAAGARHSVAITADGYIHSWGGGRHHQLLLASQPGWCPVFVNSDTDGSSHNLRFVDAAAGMNHTLALDSRGRVWSWGQANRHGQLGRAPQAATSSSSTAGEVSTSTATLGASGLSAVASVAAGSGDERLPAIVSGLPHDVIWQRVACGWSHCAARGVAIDGSPVVYMWGRADLGAVDTRSSINNDTSSSSINDGNAGGSNNNSSSSAPLRHIAPCRAGPLPNGSPIHEIWCGSEHTIAADASGGLWARGWNEHGNLGVGRRDAVVHEWLPVVVAPMHSTATSRISINGDDYVQQKLAAIWEGSVGAGGGHTLLLA